MREQIAEMVTNFRPVPGQSTDEALASLRDSFDREVHEFSQDQKIDALIDELRRTREADEPEAIIGAVDPEFRPAVMPEDGSMSDDDDASTESPSMSDTEFRPAVMPEDGSMSDDDDASTESPSMSDTEFRPAVMPPDGLVDDFDQLIGESAEPGAGPEADGFGPDDSTAQELSQPEPPGSAPDEQVPFDDAMPAMEDDFLGTAAVTAQIDGESAAPMVFDIDAPPADPGPDPDPSFEFGDDGSDDEIDEPDPMASTPAFEVPEPVEYEPPAAIEDVAPADEDDDDV
ncbi:MAG: hypothetical protein R2715_03485 [Ilumatobacteraceae bacterium]